MTLKIMYYKYSSILNDTYMNFWYDASSVIDKFNEKVS